MKILICGKCPDPLTTVAQGLNRIRSEQMRPEPWQSGEASPPNSATVTTPDKNRTTIPSVADAS
jgi:hypothetical protein